MMGLLMNGTRTSDMSADAGYPTQAAPGGIAGRIKPCERLVTGWPWGLMRVS